MALLDGFDNRIKFSIDHTKIDGNLTHFPVTLILSSTFCSEVFSDLWSNANRFKIAFTKDDGVTQLYGEIEQFDYGNSKAVYHISKNDWTIASGTNTDFYMYYDSSHADNTNYIGDTGSTPGENVWDSNFVMVQHMCQDPSGSSPQMIDSTSNDNDGTSGGDMASDNVIDGVVGKSLIFDGSSDFIAIAKNSSLNITGAITLEAFIKCSNGNSCYPICRNNNSDSHRLYTIQYYSSNVYFSYYTGSKKSLGWTWGEASDNLWHHVVISVDGLDAECFIDSVSFGSKTLSGPFQGFDTEYDVTNIGRRQGGFYMPGCIDCVRISNSARSETWIKAEYDSLSNDLITKTEGMDRLSSFDNRIKFSIDHTKIDEDLTHFPVTLILSSTFCSEVFSELESDANRFKIAFTKDDGLTQLYGEIEQFDYENSKAVYHISKNDWTIVSGTNTDFYMYYDSSHADNTNYIGDIGSTPGENVWDSNYLGIWHMCQDPSGGGACIIDSTSNNYDGTPYGSMTSEDLIDADIGKALEFDGIDDYIVPSLPFDLGDPDAMQTVEVVAKAIGTAILVTTERSTSATGDSQIFTDSLHLVYQINSLTSPPYTENIVTTSTYVSSIFNYFAVSKNITANNHILTINDTSETLNYNFHKGATGFTSLNFGRYRNYVFTNYLLTGSIREIRISDLTRSPSWVKATYDSLFDNLITEVEEGYSGISAIFFGFNF